MEFSERVVVVGGGAAGMVAAIFAAREGAKVLVLEKMGRAGRKLLITGKGRCNITNMREWDRFAPHIHPNNNFLKHSFRAFDNRATRSFFEELGVETVVEQGERLFPKSGESKSVVDALLKELERLGVEVLYNKSVERVELKEGRVVGVRCDDTFYHAGAVILATGGSSYPRTGSTGDGYLMAEEIGHKITALFPSLTALVPKEYRPFKRALTLKNVGLKLVVAGDLVEEQFGDLDFTRDGVEGSIGYRVSRKAVKGLENGNRVALIIDLKPALSIEQLKRRVARELESLSEGEGRRVATATLLKRLLPSHLIGYFMESSGSPTSLQVEELIHSLKSWTLEVERYFGYERAVVTAGGVSLKEVNGKRMSSKLYNNLFFAGEIIDLDGDTGGYNLQIAFSTGYKAGVEAAVILSKQK